MSRQFRPVHMAGESAADQHSVVEDVHGDDYLSALLKASERQSRKTRQIGSKTPSSKHSGNEVLPTQVEALQTALEVCNETLHLMEQQVRRRTDSQGSKSVPIQKHLKVAMDNSVAAGSAASLRREISVKEMSSDSANANNRLRSVVVQKPSSSSVSESRVNHVDESPDNGAKQHSMCDASTSTDGDKFDAFPSQQRSGMEQYHEGETPHRAKRSLPTVAIVSSPRSDAPTSLRTDSTRNDNPRQLIGADDTSRSTRRHSSGEPQYSLTESRTRSSIKHRNKRGSDSSDDESSPDDWKRGKGAPRQYDRNTSYKRHRRHDDSSPSLSPPRRESSGIVVDAGHRKGMMTHLRKGVNAAVIGRHTLNRINITVPHVSKLSLLNLKQQPSTMIGVNETRRHTSWPLLTELQHSCYGSCMSHPMIR